MLFSGPAGVGKTTLAKVIAKTYDLPYIYVNASDDTGVDVIRSNVKTFCSTMTVDGKMKLVIFDEADRLSGAAQDMLKGLIDSTFKAARFIFTCNSPEKMIDPLKSRAKEVYFGPVDIKLIGKRVIEILKAEKINIPIEQKDKLIQLIKKHFPDIREIINHLQYFSSSGDLEINFEELVSEEIFTNIIDLVKKKKFSEIREIMKNNKLDYEALIKKVFHAVLDTNNEHFKDLKEGQRAEIIVLCAEYIHKSLNFVIDKEINFADFIVQLMRAARTDNA
jgi:DNA polymerase III delta prime subunit